MPLVMTYDELRKSVATNAGWGDDIDAWSDEVRTAVETSIRGGLRRFLFGTTMPGMAKVYEWSFLRKRWDFTTKSDERTYLLPEDFGSLEYRFIWFTTEQYSKVPLVNEARLLSLQSLDPNTSGVTQYAATRYRTQGAGEHRQELVLYPIPSGAWDMFAIYRINGEMLSDGNQLPPGGSEHARSIEYACLAELGQRMFVNAEMAASYEASYQQSLMASVSTDSRTRNPIVGYNRDTTEIGAYMGDGMYPDDRFGGSDWVATVNGTRYDNTT